MHEEMEDEVRRRRSGRVRPFVYNLRRAPQPQPRVFRAQRRISQLLNRPLPFTGVPGPAYRWGIRRLQSRFGLPVTGMMDLPTQQIVYAADAPEPPIESAGFDDSAQPAGSDWIPPEEQPSEEINVKQGCVVVLHRIKGVDAGSVFAKSASLPHEPGIYVIQRNGQAHYVGIAEGSIHRRFLDRYKALRDFGIQGGDLAGVLIHSFVLRSSAAKLGCVLESKAKKAKQFNPVDAKLGVLRVLERRFINHYEAQIGRRLANVQREDFQGQPIQLRILNRFLGDPENEV